MSEPFTSIRHPFAIDPALGSLAEETDFAAHVEQMILQVLFTGPGERVNRPDFGCGVRRMVFAPNSVVSAALAQVTIFQSLTKWLGTLIVVNNVQAQAVDDTMEISIVYTLKTNQQTQYLNLTVSS